MAVDHDMLKAVVVVLSPCSVSIIDWALKYYAFFNVSKKNLNLLKIGVNKIENNY